MVEEVRTFESCRDRLVDHVLRRRRLVRAADCPRVCLRLQQPWNQLRRVLLDGDRNGFRLRRLREVIGYFDFVAASQLRAK